MQLRFALYRKFLSAPLDGETTRQRVYRLKEAGEVKEPWRRRIVALSNGRTVDEITRTLYLDEVERGAWLVDIGMWKTAFDRSVMDTIGELANRGYVCRKAAQQPGGRDASQGLGRAEPGPGRCVGEGLPQSAPGDGLSAKVRVVVGAKTVRAGMQSTADVKEVKL